MLDPLGAPCVACEAVAGREVRTGGRGVGGRVAGRREEEGERGGGERRGRAGHPAWQACEAVAKSLDLRGQRERALTFSLRRAAWHMRRDGPEQGLQGRAGGGTA